jgi:siroheme synthase
VAVVIDATTPEQRVWRGQLDHLADADVASPAVMVIGAVAALPLGELAVELGDSAPLLVPRG